jgi:hypothetical protein
MPSYQASRRPDNPIGFLYVSYMQSERARAVRLRQSLTPTGIPSVHLYASHADTIQVIGL